MEPHGRLEMDRWEQDPPTRQRSHGSASASGFNNAAGSGGRPSGGGWGMQNRPKRSSEKFHRSDCEAPGGYAHGRNRKDFAHQAFGPPPSERSQRTKSWGDRSVSSATSATSVCSGSTGGLNSSSYSAYVPTASGRSRRPWNVRRTVDGALLAFVALGAVVIYATGGGGRSGPKTAHRALSKLDTSALLPDLMDGDQPMENWLRGGDVDEGAMGQDQLEQLHKLKRLHQLHQLQLLQQLQQLQQQGPVDWSQVAKMIGVEQEAAEELAQPTEEEVDLDESKGQPDEPGGDEGGLPENPLASKEEGAQAEVVQDNKKELDAIKKKLEEILDRINKDAGPAADEARQAGEALAELEQARAAPVAAQAPVAVQAPAAPQAAVSEQAPAAQQAPVAEQAPAAQQAPVDQAQVQAREKKLEEILGRINKDIGPTADELRQAGEALAELEQARKAPADEQAPAEPQAPAAQQTSVVRIGVKM